MRKGRDGGENEKNEKEKKGFLVATTSLPAVYRPNGYARTPTAGTPHARANMIQSVSVLSVLSPEPTELFYCGYHALDSAALSTSYNELGQ